MDRTYFTLSVPISQQPSKFYIKKHDTCICTACLISYNHRSSIAFAVRTSILHTRRRHIGLNKYWYGLGDTSGRTLPLTVSLLACLLLNAEVGTRFRQQQHCPIYSCMESVPRLNISLPSEYKISFCQLRGSPCANHFLLIFTRPLLTLKP